MKSSVKLPIIIRVDNEGAIFMTINITTTSHIKHLDVKYKYVNEYVENEIVKIFFVKSTENDSDILMKNLCGELHEKHSRNMINEKAK